MQHERGNWAGQRTVDSKWERYMQRDARLLFIGTLVDTHKWKLRTHSWPRKTSRCPCLLLRCHLYAWPLVPHSIWSAEIKMKISIPCPPPLEVRSQTFPRSISTVRTPQRWHAESERISERTLWESHSHTPHLQHLVIPCRLALGHDVPVVTVADETTICRHESHFALRQNREKTERRRRRPLIRPICSRIGLWRPTWKVAWYSPWKSLKVAPGGFVYRFNKASRRAVRCSDKVGALCITNDLFLQLRQLSALSLMELHSNQPCGETWKTEDSTLPRLPRMGVYFKY